MADLARIRRSFTSRRWCWRFFTYDECPESLVTALMELLPHVPAESWSERIRSGGVFVNGSATLVDRPLAPPCQIEYYEPSFALDGAADHYAQFRPEYVLFEDEDLILAFKPNRLPSMPVREQQQYHFKAQLERHCGRPVHMPSRLDTSTCGVLAASKSPVMHHRLQRLFETRSVSKWYLLAVAHEPCWRRHEVDAPIGTDPAHPVLRRVTASGKPAHTEFLVPSRSAPAATPDTSARWILLARPRTGRTHQIRVHAAHIGYPIVGDNFYGGPLADSLHLMSARVSFRHPLTQQLVDVTVPDGLRPEWARGIEIGEPE